ncbi:MULTISPECIES: M20/M25/M40 family metallo-hydrolase [Ramlibacter]|uniref:M20/M25/M40 family metallo-hydrolase n=1 Tax=Ramlibacter pinisoli TaxID=2682844 RepID=A0A6N8IWC9_9BURK|nr:MULTISPECIES: M20/M25/M40 family metallo-hydrolase [Ramlibacter]MBA2965332.1 M20/M25/M40 family metallo-hydrolase [Ramlibacter sp. CGMCC 1.13660]MVQ30296.1 M20/M25/M40 family metallo-hydrolase [Ramlibacter pinisoli]
MPTIRLLARALAPLTLSLACAGAAGQPVALDPGLAPLAEKEVPALLDTLRQLTAVDSGTGQAAGLAAVADTIERLARGLGAEVARVAPAAGVTGPNLLVTFQGNGQRRLLLIAHMDTVYPAGTAAARPLRVEGRRAIAAGIADDKGGIAVFLHAMKLLQARGFRDYGRVTLLFNSDEERGSRGSRDLIRSQALAHDVVLSGEPTGLPERIVLATSGVGFLSARVRSGSAVGAGDGQAVEEVADLVLRSRDAFRSVPETRLNWTVLRAEEAPVLQRLPAADWQLATLTFQVRGRPSHAGGAPDAGINAVVEAATLVRRVLEEAARHPGVRVHARSATGGQVSNIIPERGQVVIEVALPRGAPAQPVLDALLVAGRQAALAGARVEGIAAPGLAERPGPVDTRVSADVRVPHAEAYQQLVQAMRQRVEQKRHPSSTVTLQDGLARPAYNASEEGRRLAEVAQQIDHALGGQLGLLARSYGGTDAAWAGQSGKPVIEGLGLPGGNYHSADEEYVLVDRIPRRLALVAELIRALSRR